MKRILLLFVILLVVIVALKVSNDYFQNKSLPFFSKPQAVLGAQTIYLSVAKTPQEKQTGLSGKSSISENEGMVFPFEKADYYSFWMRGMKFPIDIIYLKNNKIVTIFDNVQPASSIGVPEILNPEEPSDTVLEVKGGLAKKYNLKKGDTIRLSL